jgi:hypothetical protein
MGTSRSHDVDDENERVASKCFVLFRSRKIRRDCMSEKKRKMDSRSHKEGRTCAGDRIVLVWIAVD